MSEKKTDRRVQRTRRMLLEGLTSLLMEKNVSQISVKELTDYADINRGTFYLHFKDVYDMLQKIEDELFQEFQETLDKNMLEMESPDPVSTLLDIFELIQENQTIVKALLGPHGDMAFLSKLKDLVRDRSHFVWTKDKYNMDHFEYFNSFTLYGCIGLIEEWVSNGCDMSSKELADLAGMTILRGFEHVVG